MDFADLSIGKPHKETSNNTELVDLLLQVLREGPSNSPQIIQTVCICWNFVIAQQCPSCCLLVGYTHKQDRTRKERRRRRRTSCYNFSEFQDHFLKIYFLIFLCNTSLNFRNYLNPLEQKHSFHPLAYLNCHLHQHNNIRFWLVRASPIFSPSSCIIIQVIYLFILYSVMCS
jgi:hypothetical protein